MARMSVDDMIGRDARVAKLARRSAKQLHQHARADYWLTVGALICEVWPICYDRLCAVIGDGDADALTFEGFTADLVASGLASQTKAGLRIAGASERIEYLINARRSGSRGGKLSGAARRSKQPLRLASVTLEGGANPPDTVPDSAPSPVPESVPDGVIALPVKARALVKRASQLPVEWAPTAEHVALADERHVDLELQARTFRAHAEANGRLAKSWNAAFAQWLLKSKPDIASRVGRVEPKPQTEFMTREVEL